MAPRLRHLSPGDRNSGRQAKPASPDVRASLDWKANSRSVPVVRVRMDSNRGPEGTSSPVILT